MATEFRVGDRYVDDGYVDPIQIHAIRTTPDGQTLVFFRRVARPNAPLWQFKADELEQILTRQKPWMRRVETDEEQAHGT